MADNVTIGSGASTPVDVPTATDNIAGVNYQRVKISVGDDGTAADCGPSNPLPVSGALTVSGTMPVSVAVGQQVDGHSASIGTTTDAAATTTGSVIAQLRRIANLVAGTLTVSGTVTTTPPSNASSNVAQVAGTTTDTNSGVKSAGTQRVVLATDQPQLTNALKVDGSAVTQPVSGTISVSGTMPVSVASGQQVDGHSATLGSTTDAAATTTGSVIAQLRRVANLLAGTLTVSGTVTTTPPSNASSNVAQINGVTPLMGAGNTGTGSPRVTIATDQANLTTPLNVTGPVTNAGTFAVQPTSASATTATLTSTAASATNVANLVALNTARTGLMIHNDSTAILYLKYGTTASTSSFSVLVPANTLWEMPANPRYTGRIDGIWASATGNARITELAP